MTINIDMSKQGHVITWAKQLQFAHLSGDHNPIHIDKIYARRLLYGQAIVHGVHMLLAALEAFIQASPQRFNLKDIKVNFLNPLVPDQKFSVQWESQTSHSYFLTVLDEQGARLMACTFSMFEINQEDPSAVIPVVKEWPDMVMMVTVTKQQIRDCSGGLDLLFPDEECRAMFPGLSDTLSPANLAFFFALTRLVGMRCPGEHSLFIGFEVSFEKKTPSSTGRAPQVNYSVTSFDERFNLAKLSIQSDWAVGQVDAILRPAMVHQPELSVIAQHVNKDEFSNVNALIIGASRGIGESIAKLIAAGGGRSILTYFQGREDALMVLEDIQSFGGIAEIFQLDVNDMDALPPDMCANVNAVFYCSSPKITVEKPNASDEKLKYKYHKYFVDGPRGVMEKVLQVTKRPFLFFYPSTEYIETAVRGFKNYVDAKRRGEEVCAEMSHKHDRVTVVCPRLPRMETDQTQAINQKGGATPYMVMLKELRAYFQTGRH